MYKTKNQIRSEILHIRNMYPLDQKQHDDAIITRTLLSLDLVDQARSICTYISMHNEIDTRKLISKILKAGKLSVIAPKVYGDTLKLYRIPDLKHLIESKFGVLEPDQWCQEVLLTYPEVFITPGLAFTQDGNRLGYGKGYYDWLFTKTDKPRIAVAYDFQILETLPYEDYDMKVDILVTPTRIINCTKRLKL